MVIPLNPVKCSSFPIHTISLQHIHTCSSFSKQAPISPIHSPSCDDILQYCPMLFSISTPQKSENWRAFDTRAINYLEALNIDAEEANNNKTGWKQLKMMFKGEDRQILQTLIDNGTITLESQKMPWHVLDAIITTIISTDHFWYF